MTHVNAITKAIEALEEAAGYGFGNATSGEAQRRHEALTDLRALRDAVPDGSKSAADNWAENDDSFDALVQCAKLLAEATGRG